MKASGCTIGMSGEGMVVIGTCYIDTVLQRVFTRTYGKPRDMASIDVSVAPSSGETLNYTSKEPLGAGYVLPKVGICYYGF